MTLNAEILADSPVTYYRLDEASGNFTDSGSGAVTGTATGGITYSVASLDRGSANASITLNGTTGYVDMGDVYDFAATAAFTVEILINNVSFSTTPILIGKAAIDGSGVQGWWLTISPGGDVAMNRALNSSFETSNGPTTLVTGRAYHLAATFSGSSLIAYVNGVAGTPVSSTLSLANHAITARVGHGGDLGRFTNATIDEAAIYTTALSAARILVHAQEAGYSPVAQRRSFRMPDRLSTIFHKKQAQYRAQIAADYGTIRQVPSYLLTEPGFKLTPGVASMPSHLPVAWTRRPPLSNRGYRYQGQDLFVHRDLTLQGGTAFVSSMEPRGTGIVTPMEPGGTGQRV